MKIRLLSIVAVVGILAALLVSPNLVQAKGASISASDLDDPRCLSHLEMPAEVRLGASAYGHFTVQNVTSEWLWFQTRQSSNVGAVSPYASRLMGYPQITSDTPVYISVVHGDHPYKAEVHVDVFIEGDTQPCASLEVTMKVRK